MRDGQGAGLLRPGRQLRLGDAGHGTHRGRPAVLDLTVHVSTKLNRSHVVTGERGADPALPGPHRAGPPGRRATRSSPSRTRWAWCTPPAAGCDPASPDLLSEVAIVTRLAEALWPDGRAASTGPACGATTRSIRDHIERVIPGFDDFNARIEEPGGFALPHPPRDRLEFPTATGKARFTANELEIAAGPRGHLILQTCAATTSSTPRSTGSTTATAASSRAAGWSS